MTLSKSKGVKEMTHRRYCAMSGSDRRFMENHECENKMPPTILDDDIADWEFNNLESK